MLIRKIVNELFVTGDLHDRSHPAIILGPYLRAIDTRNAVSAFGQVNVLFVKSYIPMKRICNFGDIVNLKAKLLSRCRCVSRLVMS